MNCIFKYISIAVAAVCTIVGCKESYVTYSDAEYVMFADTMATYPVQKDVEYFSIPVVVSKSAMTPFFIGRVATILPGVRPIIF